MSVSRGPCRDFLDEFSNFVDGTLDSGQRALLLAHLDCCETCLRHLKAYRKGIAAYRDANAPVPVWGLYDRVVEQLGGSDSPASTQEIASVDRTRRRRGGSRVGAVMVMAVLAMLLLVPPSGLDFDGRANGPATSRARSPEVAPTSYASVIPAALSTADRRPPDPKPVRIAQNLRSERFRNAGALTIDQIPEVPRRELRIVRVLDVGGSGRMSGFGSWAPRRPPVIVRHASSVVPATWVAEAALRIP